MKPKCAILLFLTAAPALADPCGLSVSSSNIFFNWTQANLVQTIPVTVSKSKTPACNFGVVFSKGGASNYDRRMAQGVATLNYQLYKDASLSQVLKDQPDVTSSSDFIFGTLPTGTDNSQSVNYLVNVPLPSDQNLRPAGTYTDLYAISVWRMKDSTKFEGNAEGVANIQISTFVPKIIGISLVASGGIYDPTQISQTLNFGTLIQGKSLGFDIRIQSNVGFTVTMSSQNAGALKHASPTVTTQVPYTMTVNSQAVVFTNGGPTPVATGTGQTSLNGTALPVQVIVGNPGSALAGSYSDNITVTVAAKD